MEKIRFISLLALVFLFSGCSLSSKETVPVETGGPNLTPSSIYGANDGGSNWLPLHDDTEKIESADILSIAMSPADENLALFGTVDNGIIRTSDKGQNFEFLTNFKAEKVYGLELDPRDPRIIYASGVWQKRGKIYKSQDSGETWKEIYTEPADGPLIVSMALSGTSGDILYVGNSDGAVFRSLNQGATWSRIFSSDYPITKIVVGKKNAGQIFLISDSGQVFRGDGSRGGFSDITSNIKKTITADGGIFAGDFDSRGTLYLGGKIGLIKSSDGGNSWSDIPVLNDSENFPIRALAVNPGNDREIIFGAARAVYRTSDGGENWAGFQLDNSSKIAGILEFSPANPSLVYLGLFKK